MSHASEQTGADIIYDPVEPQAWVVAHVRPRCEKKLELFCQTESIPVYVPLKRSAHQYEGRVRVFMKPLFPGYVFCLCNPQQKQTVKQNQYTANLLTVVNQAALVHQLRQLVHALSVGDAVEVMPYLEKGKRVRVTGGPFKGLEGIVERIAQKTNVVISIEMIQQSVFMEVDGMFVEAV